MKTDIEAITPVLAGLLIPSQIRLKMSREEKVWCHTLTGG